MNGILLINKPSGITSHDVVHGLRKALKTKQIGHAGTLDPLASGLLICLVGEATKLSHYVMVSDKQYRVKVRFGLVTDSDDITGNVISKNEAQLEPSKITSAALSLQGKLELVVPKISAIKIGGKKLYEYAREGKDIDLPTREMTINQVDVLETSPQTAVFDVSCSRGTYIRSWAQKLGDILGVGACVESLVRLQSGSFSVNHALDFEECVKAPELYEKSFISIEDVLRDWPVLKVRGRDEKLLRNGQIPLGLMGYLSALGIDSGVRVLAEKGGLLALLTPDEQKKAFRIARVFNGS